MYGENSYPSKPTVSVILPTFNRAASLEAAIHSVLTQTYTDFELIVVDDGSTDETPALVKAIPDRRICSIRLNPNRGAAAARNAGIRASAANFIAFQDSDDFWSPQKLAVQVERMQNARPTTGVVYSSYCWQHGARQGVTPSRGREFLNRTGLARYRLQGNLWHSLPRGNFITTPAALVKRECLEKAGGFDERLPRLQDWDLWLRLACQYDYDYINLPLVNTYLSSNSISLSQTALIFSFEVILEKYRHLPEVYRQIAAQRHFTLGRQFLSERRFGPARRQTALTLRNAPGTAVYWLEALAVLGSPRLYRRLLER